MKFKCEICGLTEDEANVGSDGVGLIACIGGCKSKNFEDACRPLIKYLSENHHPHTLVLVTSNSAEAVEGIKTFRTTEYLKD